MRAPNLLQNLLGEQTLSAAFIPVYSRMLEDGRSEAARRLAGSICGLLVAVVCGLVLFGWVFASPLVALLLPGYLGDSAAVAAGEMAVDRFPLAVAAVRVVFPMAGFLVLSSWALGVLNSHRRFLLAYLAPVAWNAAIIAALLAAVIAGGHLKLPTAASFGEQRTWLFAALWGGLLGGLLQLAVQLPLTLRLLGGLRLSVSTSVAGVRTVLARAAPALAGRGVVQLSAYVDTALASLLAVGALAALVPAQVLYLLPLSAFGLSVAAAELPELARIEGRLGREAIAARLRRAVLQSGFLIVPAAVGYLLLGFHAVTLLYRGGSFGVEGHWLVTAVLAGYSVGLPASMVSRQLQNTYYALGDTRTPAWIAAVRLVVSAASAAALMLWLDTFAVGSTFGVAAVSGLRLGAVGLAVASALAAWIELALLRARLRRELPGLGIPWRGLCNQGAAAGGAAAVGLALWWVAADWNLYLVALSVLAAYGGLYLGVAWARGSNELRLWLGRPTVR